MLSKYLFGILLGSFDNLLKSLQIQALLCYLYFMILPKSGAYLGKSKLLLANNHQQRKLRFSMRIMKIIGSGNKLLRLVSYLNKNRET